MEHLRRLAKLSGAFLAASAALMATGPAAFAHRLVEPDPGTAYSLGGANQPPTAPDLDNGISGWEIGFIALSAAVVILVAVAAILRLSARRTKAVAAHVHAGAPLMPSPAAMEGDPYAAFVERLDDERPSPIADQADG